MARTSLSSLLPGADLRGTSPDDRVGRESRLDSAGQDPEPLGPGLDEAFGAFYRRHFGTLVAFFSRRGEDAEVSRDLAQDAMLRAYRGFSEFEARHVERAQMVWLRRIALRVWANWIRAHRGTLKRSGTENSLESAQEFGFEPGATQGLWTDQTAADPERQVIEAQARDRIGLVLGRLPTRQRECLELWLAGVSYQEIAEQLGTSLQTVRSSLHKAKANVRAHLADVGPNVNLAEHVGGQR